MTKIAQRRGEEIDLFWRKEMTPDGNLNPQEEMKSARNGKYES